MPCCKSNYEQQSFNSLPTLNFKPSNGPFEKTCAAYEEYFLIIQQLEDGEFEPFFLQVIEVLLIRKVQCVYDSKPTALEMNTNKSNRKANKN